MNASLTLRPFTPGTCDGGGGEFVGLKAGKGVVVTKMITHIRMPAVHAVVSHLTDWALPALTERNSNSSIPNGHFCYCLSHFIRVSVVSQECSHPQTFPQ
jgi:hypothetical protein